MNRLMAFGVVVLAVAAGAVRVGSAGCEAAGKVQFVCGQAGPEDLIVVPGGRWMISSGMVANGALRLIDLRDHTTTVLFPGTGTAERLDKTLYSSCPGPIDPSEGVKFRAHGLYLRRTGAGQYRLFMVHHGNR